MDINAHICHFVSEITPMVIRFIIFSYHHAYRYYLRFRHTLGLLAAFFQIRRYFSLLLFHTVSTIIAFPSPMPSILRAPPLAHHPTDYDMPFSRCLYCQSYYFSPLLLRRHYAYMRLYLYCAAMLFLLFSFHFLISLRHALTPPLSQLHLYAFTFSGREVFATPRYFTLFRHCLLIILYTLSRGGKGHKMLRHF